MKWAFVDYENIGTLSKINLSSYEKIFVFMGAKQPKLDFSEVKYDHPLELVVIQVKDSSPNNLDFHLSYHVGKQDCLAARAIEFHVISNDQGFNPLVEHINTSGRACSQIYIPFANHSMSKVIDDLKVCHPKNRPAKIKTLKNFIKCRLGSPKDSDIDKSVNSMISDGLIKVDDSSVKYLF